MPPQNERIATIETFVKKMAEDLDLLTEKVDKHEGRIVEQEKNKIVTDNLVHSITDSVEEIKTMLKGNKWTLNRIILIAKDVAWVAACVWIGLVLLNPTALNQKIQQQLQTQGTTK